MATVTRKGSKSKTAGMGKAAPAKTETAASPTPKRAKFAPSKAEVVKIAERLRAGAKMNEIKEEHGLSNGQPVRKALLEHGFDSKGNKNPEGLTAREAQAARRAAAPAETPKAKTPAKGKTTSKAKKGKPDPSPQA